MARRSPPGRRRRWWCAPFGSSTPGRCWRCCPATRKRRPGYAAATASWAGEGRPPAPPGARGGWVAPPCHTGGPERFTDASRWWTEQAGTAVVRDEVGEPGSGLVCFGSFAFADDPGDSVLVVPEVVLGRRGSTTWVTTIGLGTIPSRPRMALTDNPDAPVGLAFADGALTGAEWETVVAEAVQRIEGGALEKVVLARDLIATA